MGQREGKIRRGKLAVASGKINRSQRWAKQSQRRTPNWKSELERIWCGVGGKEKEVWRGGGVLQVSCKLKPELERSLAAY